MIYVIKYISENPELYWVVGIALYGLLVSSATTPLAVPGDNSRTRWLRIPAHPASFVLLLAAMMYWFRWPAFLVPHQLNPDESQMIAQSARYLLHPVPWRGVDGTTGGPVNSYLLVLFRLVGIDIGYGFARAIAVFCVLANCLLLYVGLRPHFREGYARTAVLPLATFYALVVNSDLVHYSSELVPVLLLAVAVSASWRWLARPNKHLSLFIAAAALGAVPFAKMQAAPTALALGLLLVGILLARGVLPNRRPWHWIVLTAGGLAVPLLILVPVTIVGALRYFWVSYIEMGAGQGGGVGHWGGLYFLLFGIPTTSLFYLAVGAWIVVAGLSAGSSRLRGEIASGERRSLILITSVYVLFSFIVTMVPRNHFLHHTQFIAHAAGIACALAFCLLSSAQENIASTVRVYGPGRRFLAKIRVGIPTLIGLSLTIWTYRSRRNIRNKIRVIIPVLLVASFFIPLLAFRFWIGQQNPYVGVLRDDLHEPPDATVALIRKLARPKDLLAVWGWAPQYFVESGLTSATRDVIGHFLIFKSTHNAYFLSRYMQDLRASRPPIFVDAVSPSNFAFHDPGRQGHDIYPALRAYVTDNYHLVPRPKNCGVVTVPRVYVSLPRYHDLERKTPYLFANHCSFVVELSRAMEPIPDVPLEINGRWARSGIHPAAPPAPWGWPFYGSWDGADQNTGVLRLGPLRCNFAMKQLVLPYTTGPVSKGLSLTVERSDSGKVLYYLDRIVASPGVWKGLLFPVSNDAARLRIIARDDGRGWGEWLAVSPPRCGPR